MGNILPRREIKFDSLAVDLRVLAQGEAPGRMEADLSAWEEIDGWEDSTHAVSILWRTKNGKNQFSLNLIPKTGQDPAAAEMSFNEVQSVRHEQHAYPFIAPKVGHLAAVEALGIPEAA